jgi:hypothetical protein
MGSVDYSMLFSDGNYATPIPSIGDRPRRA